jgi:hypothetical protein
MHQEYQFYCRRDGVVMMNTRLGTMLALSAVLISIIGAFSWLAYWGASVTCVSQWRDSGMEARFALFAGCQIQLPNGTWIPAQAYREIP